MRRTNRGNDPTPRPRPTGHLAVVALLVSAFTFGSRADAAPPSHAAKRPVAGLRPTLDASELSTLRRQILALDFADLADAFATGHGRADRCSVSPEQSECSSVELTSDAATLSARQMTFGDRRSVEHLVFAPAASPRVYQVERVTVDGETLRLQSVRAREDSGAEWRAESGRIAEKSVHLTNLAWRETSTRRKANGRRLVMRSESAVYRANRWQFERLRRAARPTVGLGAHRAPRGRPSTGLVPPRVTYGAERVEWTQWAVHGPSLLGLSATAALPGGWFGIGPTIQTPPDQNPFADRSPRPALLDGQLRWNADSRDLGWAVTGNLRRGTEYTHVGAHLEEVSSDEYWRTERVEAPGLLRNWRESRAGTSLSGPSHHLQLRFGHWDRAVVDADSTPRLDTLLPGERFEFGVEYGAVHHLADFLEATTGVFHRNSVLENGADAHRTLAVGDVTGRLGSQSGPFAELGATAMLGSALGPPDSGRGFDATGTSQLIAHVRTGLTVTGRPATSLIHRLAPEIAGYREIANFGSGGSGDTAGRPGAPTHGWTAFAATLDQQLLWSGGRLRVPVGLLLHGAGAKPLIDETCAFGRLRLDVGRYGLFGGLRHTVGTRRTGVTGGAGYYAPGLDLTWQWTTESAADRHLARIDQLLADPVDAARLLQPHTVPDARSRGGSPLFQTVSLGGEIGEVRTDVGLFSEGAFDANGVTVGLAHGFEPLGWGLAVEGAYAIQSERWGVSAGLQTSR